MKKVLVIGDSDRVQEFKKLNLQHAEVTYHEFPGFDNWDLDWNNMDAFEDEEEGEDEGEDGEKEIMLGIPEHLRKKSQDDEEMEEDEEDEDDDLIFGEGGGFGIFDDDDDEEDGEGGSGLYDVDTEGYDIVFDLNFDDDTDAILNYLYNENQIVIGCTVKRSLSEMLGGAIDTECKFYGMNALPTFIDRPKLELCMAEPADLMVLEATMKTLGLDYELVQDQVGMVTPRVVCMIINEAAFVLGEGTATVQDVDLGMKLGTNYPKGPFEWCDAIGVHNVVAVIEALQRATGDSRYKLAPRLRRQGDLDLRFYPEA
ncbi:MAG: 3-hydroxyacyl-CoA dehydrogenase family protein [Bacteroidia bacterium]